MYPNLHEMSNHNNSIEFCLLFAAFFIQRANYRIIYKNRGKNFREWSTSRYDCASEYSHHCSKKVFTMFSYVFSLPFPLLLVFCNTIYQKLTEHWHLRYDFNMNFSSDMLGNGWGPAILESNEEARFMLDFNYCLRLWIGGTTDVEDIITVDDGYRIGHPSKWKTLINVVIVIIKSSFKSLVVNQMSSFH